MMTATEWMRHSVAGNGNFNPPPEGHKDDFGH